MSIAEKFVTMEYGPAPEDPKEAQAWLLRHGHKFGHFINGDWQAPAAAGTSTAHRPGRESGEAFPLPGEVVMMEHGRPAPEHC